MSIVRIGLYCTVIILTVSGGVRAERTSRDGINLTLRSVQDEYIVREPIKLVVTLTNNSGKEIRIPWCQEFDMNMSWIYYVEVTTPKGERQCRRYQFLYVDGIINEGYTGEPLSPGDYREFYLYPNATWTIDCATLDQVGPLGVTFSEAGEYRVRVFYVVPSYFRRLWKQDGGLASNEITLKFREPEPEEREILGALWGRSMSQLNWGDDSDCGSKADVGPSRRVIERYPDHPLIKYAYFELARILSISRKPEKAGEGARLLEMLAQQYPEFRYEEVHMALARCYFSLLKYQEATRVLNETLERSPGLVDNYYFMHQKIYTETRSMEAIARWREDRCRGANEVLKKPRKEQ